MNDGFVVVLNQEHRGVLLSIFGSFWAAAYLIPYKAAVQWVSAEVLTLAMLLVAAVLNSLTTLMDRRRRPLRIDRLSLEVAVVLGALSVLGNFSMAEALVSIDPGIASVLLRTQVLLVGLLGWWFLGERVTGRFAAGALLALVGLSMLKTLPVGGFVLSTAGMLWALLAALSFAVMQVVIRAVIHRIHPVEVNALRLWIAVGMLACLTWRSSSLAQVGGRGWLLAAAAAVFGPFLSRICLMLSVRHIPVALSMLVTLSNPLFAFLFGVLAFKAWPTSLELIGGGVMLVGIAIGLMPLIRLPDRVSDTPTG